MKIIINKIPPSLNKFAGRSNVHTYRALKKEWSMLVWAACMQSKDLPIQPMQKAIVRIQYFFPNLIRHDPDNYCGKLLMDGLTASGVIEDDDFNHISLFLAGGYDKENPRTEITVTEVQPMIDIALLKCLVRNKTIRFYTDGGILYCENLKNGEVVQIGEAHHE